MKRGFLVVALMSGLKLGACGGGSGGDGSVEGASVTVQMYDNRFQYDEIRVPVGGQVTRVGAGRNPHNAVAADGSWSTGDVFGNLDQLEGDIAVITYDEPGEHVFSCTFHGNAEGDGMAGLLIVGEG